MKIEKEISNSLAVLASTMLTKSANMNSRIQNIENLAGLNQSNVEQLTDKLSKVLSNPAFKEKKYVSIPLESKAILSTGAVNDPLSPAHHHTVAQGARTRHVRDLLPVVPITEGSVDYPYLSGSTNNAGPTVAGSPEQFENVALGESAYDFALAQKLAVTIGHTVPISKQLLDDSNTTALAAFVESEMRHGLSIAEDIQLLTGTGSNGQVTSLITSAAAYTELSPQLTNRFDRLAYMIEQVELSDFAPGAIVLHPTDWRAIRTSKAGTSNDEYIIGAVGDGRSIWDTPVFTSNQIGVGNVLVGDFLSCGILFEREAPTLEIAYHHNNDFTSNMATLRLLERVVMMVSHPAALVTGTI